MIQVNREQLDRERDDYLEDVQIAERREVEERKFKLKLTKAELAGKHKYKTIERSFVALAKCIPYCLCVMAILILSLFGRPTPPALEASLK